jgi:hypothetical protein
MPEETMSPSASPQEPRSAWSPTGIAIVSLLLSPIPGGVLHALNYRRLGAPARGRLDPRAMPWLRKYPTRSSVYSSG